MPNVEKVIKGLEHCVEKLDTVVNKTHGFNCTTCPYFRKCDRSGYLIGLPLMRDAFELLKAQEPRVMTLEEVLATEVVYAEDIDKDEIIPVLVDRRAHDRIVLVRARLMGSPSLTIYPLISEYGKYWRCWTSRPTDEQREATPWN